MSKLPVLSGRELIKILTKVGFQPARARERGSHIILIKAEAGENKAVVVPNHQMIDYCIY
jgi:predicted RNA binding protein YcfA (HicA-like mRNA interferase family)